MFKVEISRVYSSGRSGNWEFVRVVGRGSSLRSPKRAMLAAQRDLARKIDASWELWYWSVIDMRTTFVNTNTGKREEVYGK